MDLAENEIILRFKQGESESFTELYDAYVRKIYDFIYFRTFHQETAEDLTSQVFLKALEKIHSFNPSKGSFSTWLYAIARNTVIDHVRTKKPHEDLEQHEYIASAENIMEQADTQLKKEQVLKMVMSLPEETRDVVIMRAWDGWTYKEIAEVLEKSEASIKMSFSRAVEKLKTQIPAAILALIFLNL